MAIRPYKGEPSLGAMQLPDKGLAVARELVMKLLVERILSQRKILKA